MSTLTREEVKELIQTGQPGPCVSFFMPTRQAGPETRENPIRFKNLVTEAEEQLIDEGMRAPEARRLLQPAADLVDDFDFWQNQRKGLAAFLGPELFRTYRLPLEFEELLAVGQRFHLKPLLPLLGADAQFYVLALSQNEVRLFKGSRDSMEQVDLDDVPESLAEALRFDEPLKQQQFHTATSTPGAARDRPAMFHGHGVGSDEDNENLLRYCQKLDRGLSDLLEDSGTPLILAGVEYLFPIYHEANSYPHLLEQGITGNPEAMSAAELHEQAWSLIEAGFEKERQEAVARYEALSDTDQISNDLAEIVPAAHYGRVETLFVAKGERQWGNFYPETKTFHLHPEKTSSSDDVIDLAAVQTVLQSGKVYVVAPEEVPGEPPVAAIFRYEL